MSNFKNSEVAEHILKTLASKISRRTSESFSAMILDEALKELKTKYNFLKYVDIQDTAYLEWVDAISISPKLDLIDSSEFNNAIGDVIKTTVKLLKKNADFFFIREFQGALGDIYDLDLKERNIDLRVMQLRYLVDREQGFQIENSKIVENVIRALFNVVNRMSSDTQKIKTAVSLIRDLEKNYDFLKYVKVSDRPNSKNRYATYILPGINDVHPVILAEGIQRLIYNLGRLFNWKDAELFMQSFKTELGENYLNELEEIGVNLEHVKVVLLQQGHKPLVKKILNSLVNLICKYDSIEFSLAVIDGVIRKLKEKYDFLKYIKIDKSRYAEGTDAISVMSEINNVESYKLGRAFREVIKMTGKEIANPTELYIEEFKKQLGDEALHEIEKMGVNLYFMELQYG